MRCLVVGHGSIGKRHAGNLAKLGHELGIVEPDEERRSEAARTFAAKTFATLEAALREPWDVAIIATPTAFHAGDALACARRGLHLLIEKPLAPSWSGIDELRREVEGRGLVVRMGFNLRYHPALVAARERIGQGVVGEVHHVRAIYGNHLPRWRPTRDYRQVYSSFRALGGGILLDATHELDYVDWLLGRRPVEAFARSIRAGGLETDVESVVDLVLVYGPDITATIHLDSIDRRYSRSFSVVGSQGSLNWEWGGPLIRHDANGAEAERLAFDAFDFNATYVQQLESFLRAVRGEPDTGADLRDGIANVATVRAIRRSDALGAQVRIGTPPVIVVSTDPGLRAELAGSLLVDEVREAPPEGDVSLALRVAPGASVPALDAFILSNLRGDTAARPPEGVTIMEV